MEVVDESWSPYGDVIEYVKESAKRASGFLVIAFFENEAPELAQHFRGPADIDKIIATLEKLKTRYVMAEVEDYDIVRKEDE